MRRSEGLIAVWDPVVRVGHWLLVASFFTAYFTEDGPRWLHVWAGYLLLAVVLVRILWGFVGTPYARFRHFVRPPGEAWRYLLAELRGRAARYLGHNPAGGLMILALLLGLIVTTIAGMVVLAMEEGGGPLAGWLVPQLPEIERAGREVEAPALLLTEEIHEIAANVTLALVALHVIGVVLGSWRQRENLIGAMFTGRKRPGGRSIERPEQGGTGAGGN